MKSRTSFLYFFFTLALLCILTMGKYRFEASSLKKNYYSYEEIEANVVEVNLNRNGYIVTLSANGEIFKREVYVTDDEAEELYDKMRYDSSNKNRIKEITLPVRLADNGKVYSEEDYRRACSGENPDALFYSIILVLSIISFGRVFIKGGLKKED